MNQDDKQVTREQLPQEDRERLEKLAKMTSAVNNSLKVDMPSDNKQNLDAALYRESADRFSANSDKTFISAGPSIEKPGRPLGTNSFAEIGNPGAKPGDPANVVVHVDTVSNMRKPESDSLAAVVGMRASQEHMAQTQQREQQLNRDPQQHQQDQPSRGSR